MRRLDLPESDAYVVGSGPNGLSAAIVVAKAGLSVTVLEREPDVGGSCRSAALTRPGFSHDVCAAVFPLAASSPFFRTLPLERHGLEWVRSPACLAHPFDDGTAALLWPSVERTLEELGEPARGGYGRLLGAFLPGAADLLEDILAPVAPPRIPSRPVALARFGLWALRPGASAARGLFETERGRALFAGIAAHSTLPLERPMSAAAGIVLALAGHVGGWPLARGGAQALTGALVSHLRALGGTLRTSTAVESLDQLPPARVVLCDVAPRALAQLAGTRLPAGFRRRLERFRHGPAAYKLDWALDRPIPWAARACAEAATVHLGGTLAEVAESERAAWTGAPSPRPFLLVCQPSLFDSSRAPSGAHTAWAYAHVPNAYAGDVSEAIEAQVERFAPGFRKSVIARSVLSPADLERHNVNLVGGDIGGGVFGLGQAFFRPTARLYGTPLPNVFLCSSSTPPGGGVHGMCGFHAARRALEAASKTPPA